MNNHNHKERDNKFEDNKFEDKMNLMMACEILELTYPCSSTEIRKAYYKGARKHHPDHNKDTFNGTSKECEQ